jgi:hypothetical protein
VKRFFALLLALALLPLPASADVEIVPGSDINLVARDANIPITVRNTSDEAVQIQLVGESTSFRLEVLEATNVTIPPQSSQIAELPVRAIANGPVEIRVWLEVAGEKVSDDNIIAVNVNYDVELFLLVSFAVAMFALMIVGIIRTTMRLRNRRGE